MARIDRVWHSRPCYHIAIGWGSENEGRDVKKNGSVLDKSAWMCYNSFDIKE